MKKKIVVVFIALTLLLVNLQGLNTYALQKVATGYVDLPSWITTGKVNVRSNPSTDDSIVGTIKENEKVDILDGITEDNDKNGLRQGWYKVSYSNISGYVFGDYVKLEDENGIYKPSGTKVKGIDVSYYQGKIDWQKVKDDGIKFAIIRGGYSTVEDINFKTNIEGALDAGLDVGVYWFSHAYTIDKAKAEAQKCMSVISKYKSKLTYPVFFDFEEKAIQKGEENNKTITMVSASNICKTFLNTLKSNGYKCGIYTNNLFAKYYFDKEVRTSYNTWIAQYADKCTYWNKYNMWQYSQKGKVNGIDGYVDLNYYYKPSTTKPSEVNNLKVSSTTTSSIKLTWSEVSNATGYQVYRATSKNGTYSRVRQTTIKSTISYTNTGLSSGKTYYYKVRAYKTVNGKNYYSNYTDIITTSTKPKSPTITLSSPSTKSIKVSWKKVSGATGYEVYRSTSKSGTYSKRKDTTNLSYTNTGLTKGKTYYYKVRAYKIVNDKKVYSSYSTIKYIKSI